MKRSTREMSTDELEAFLQLTHHQIYDNASKFQPGVVEKMVIITIFNLLIIGVTCRTFMDHMVFNYPFTWWMWIELAYLFLSFGWIHQAFPSPHTARQLCDEQELILEQRKRRRM